MRGMLTVTLNKKHIYIMKHPGNHVLTDDLKYSQNFFRSDKILNSYFKKHTSENARSYMHEKLLNLGRDAATVMDSLSLDADKNGPELVKRSPYGETINHIRFHPSYWMLMDIALQSEMIHVKYDAELRKKFSADRHKLGFAAGQIYGMSEMGIYCPLCMTDGAAMIVDKYCNEADRKRLLPGLSSCSSDKFLTGAMYLTEKAGGSDVGANRTKAVRLSGREYTLAGEKWFCSNANADVILALARTGPLREGTKGLSLFLVEKTLEDGKKNPVNIVRLKEKLGVRSMATAEIMLEGTKGKLIGEEGQGFKIMAEMINMSRLYNAVAAIAGMRRAIAETWQYLNHRVTFGKKAVEHPLIREKLCEAGSNYTGSFLLVWRAIRAMDAAENGDENERQLLRILIPMAKWHTAEQSVGTVRDCMELMGGNGYIEDFILPKLFRDVNVLPIWEGSGNIIVLDILRAINKTEALEQLVTEIKDIHDDKLNSELDKLLSMLSSLSEKEQDTVETTAKMLFKHLIHLYQLSLMKKEIDEDNKGWITPSIKYMTGILNPGITIKTPPDVETVQKLIAWDF